jgi:Cu/Ag efflux pump CusA
MWGPVAASIVWGLGFSSVLTLFAIPLIYRLVMRPRPPVDLDQGAGQQSALISA